jgi:potassium-transporting ATPase KdpC subunit
MNLIFEAIKAVRISIVLWVLVAVIYPTIIFAVGQIVFPYQANGSQIENDRGETIGSALIGQSFTSDRYFNSRPSTTSYSSANPQNDTAGILKTGVSGASNLAPSNPALLDRIKGKSDSDPERATTGEISRLQAVGIKPTADLLYASGSSLDPHISLESAKAQITRIARVRQLKPEQLEDLIQDNTDGRSLGIFGEAGANVLKLNIALDKLDD